MKKSCTLFCSALLALALAAGCQRKGQKGGTEESTAFFHGKTPPIFAMSIPEAVQRVCCSDNFSGKRVN